MMDCCSKPYLQILTGPGGYAAVCRVWAPLQGEACLDMLQAAPASVV